MTSVAVIIPFRDRGTDPLRAANIKRVLHEWHMFTGMPRPTVVHDGRVDDETAQFNRHAAYNRGAAQTGADVLVYAESDMLVDAEQIHAGVALAARRPGLVVPYTERHELGPAPSNAVRAFTNHPQELVADVVKHAPWRIGAINIISRATLDAIGRWDESFEGNWWDDRSMHRAFEICAGPTEWIPGRSWHLYHLPGHEGTHLTGADRAATARNKARFRRYQRCTTPEQIRSLTLSDH